MKIFKNYLQLILTWISFCFFCFLLASCATAGKNALPQSGDMTMAEIYKQETGLSLDNSQINAASATDKELAKARNIVLTLEQPIYTGYTAAGINSVKNLFKPLPNPEIGLYVFPHLVFLKDEAQPVPGYTTAFFLYQQNHFAIPEDG